MIVAYCICMHLLSSAAAKMQLELMHSLMLLSFFCLPWKIMEIADLVYICVQTQSNYMQMIANANQCRSMQYAKMIKDTYMYKLNQIVAGKELPLLSQVLLVVAVVVVVVVVPALVLVVEGVMVNSMTLEVDNISQKTGKA